MKRPITPSYTFTPGSSSLILSGIAGFSIANLFAVIDLKTGALIYAPLAGYGYTELSGTTLTLQASMSGLSAADPLLILYDDGGKPAEDASVQAVATAIGVLSTEVSTNHADLATLHTDVGTTLHADLQAILTDLNNGLTNDTAALTAIATTATWQANVLSALALLNTDAGSNHGDLTALHTDVGTTLHADLAAILAKLGTRLSISIDADTVASLPVTVGKSATAGDAALTAGGTAQTLFAGATPANGWKVANPDPAEDLWVSDSATAVPNGLGSFRIPAGGIITTEPGERPCGPVSVYAATTGHPITARQW